MLLVVLAGGCKGTLLYFRAVLRAAQHCATPIGTVTVPSFPAGPVTASVTQAQRLTMMAPK